MATTLTLGLFGLAACSDQADPEVIAETEMGEITKEEFYEALKETAGESVLQRMIIADILNSEYDVSDEDIDAKIDEFKEQFGDQFPMWLASMGIEDESSSVFRNQIEMVVLQEALESEGIEVTEEEAEEKYQEMLENREIEIQASHILVEDEEDAIQIKQELDDGADFAELAQEHSTDATAANGGDLGYFAKGNMIPEFEDAAYSLAEGEISDPVESEHGYHIIMVTDIPSFEDKKEAMLQAVKQDKINPEDVQARFDQLIEDANIKINIKDLENLFDQ